ncbi:MAG: radical SAM protein [Candidatus Altiarchaeota archaeon]|nr:radical SAM protein [Candidatus Altiarchaeota archaeon]
MPIDHILRLGLNCNFDCPFCNVLDFIKLPERTLQDLKSEIDKLVGSKLVLSLSGGEPLLYPILDDVIKYAKLKGFRVRLQTNASLINENRASELKKTGLDNAFINLPSHLPETYAELTSTDPKMFHRAIKGINYLTDAGISTVLNKVVTQKNFTHLSDYLIFVKEKCPKAREVNFSIIQPHGRAFINSHLVPDYRELREPMIGAVRTANELGIKLLNPYCGLPLCMVWGSLHPSENSEYLAGIEVRRGGKIPAPLSRVLNAKQATKSCSSCFLKNFCLGVWKKYYGIRGDVVEPPYRVLRYWPKSKVS